MTVDDLKFNQIKLLVNNKLEKVEKERREILKSLSDDAVQGYEINEWSNRLKATMKQRTFLINLKCEIRKLDEMDIGK